MSFSVALGSLHRELFAIKRTHYIKSQVDFCTEVHKAIVDAADKSHEKYVILVMDEIFIKSDLVYDKLNGSLIGFVNIGNINNQSLEFEKVEEEQIFIWHQLWLCLRMYFTSFDAIWEAMAWLERSGFFALALCCDGTSSNQKLWKFTVKIMN